MKTHKGLKKLVSVEGKLHFTCGPTAKKKKSGEPCLSNANKKFFTPTRNNHKETCEQNRETSMSVTFYLS